MRNPAELLDAASKLPPGARDAYLDEQCGADAALRAELGSLLSHLDQAAGDGFLNRSPLPGPIIEPKHVGIGLLPAGTRIRGYQIERVLGEGGMGVVYVARQSSPQRLVALKVIRAGAAGRSALRRFQREAELLGRLQHPGIAQIFEAGIATLDLGMELPFLAMELIEGVPLNEYVASRRPDLRARLELLARVCEAVQHAHERGLIHRDLKPANILVTPADDPKVLDFGVARALDHQGTVATETGQLIGTIAYMSPEQVGGEPAALDTRSDVYSLGVILYELVAGRLPHDVRDKTILDAARLIRDSEPTRLRAVNRGLRGDIETIALRALERQRERRYASAAALAEDLRRYLAGDPILARQDSALYILNARLRRYRWAFAAGLIFLLLVTAFGVWAATQAQAFRRLASSEAAAKGDALAQGQRVREQLRQSEIERGRALAVRGDLRAAEGSLWAAFAADPGSADAGWALREVQMRFPCVHVLSGGDADVLAARFSPDGRMLVTAGDLGVVWLWDTATGELRRALRGHRGRLYCVRFSPDGSLLASAGYDSVIRLWHAADGAPAGQLSGHRGVVTDLAFSRDGSRLYSTGQDGMLREWDVCDRSLARETRTSRAACWSVRLDAEELRVVTCDQSGFVQVRARSTFALLREFQAHVGSAQSVAFSPRGDAMVSAGRDSTLAIWDAWTWEPRRRADVGVRGARRAEFSPDGTSLVVTGSSTSAVVDAATLEPRKPGIAESQGGWASEFSPDGAMMVTTSSNPGAARLWATGPYAGMTTVAAHRASVTALATDGRRVASGGSDGAYALWDAAGLRQIHRWTTSSPVRAVAFAADGARMASAHANGRVRISQLDDEAFGWASFRAHAGSVDSLAFLPDGRLATAGADAMVHLWDRDGKQRQLSIRADGAVTAIAVSPDGRWIAGNTERSTTVWDTQDGAVAFAAPDRGAGSVRGLAFDSASRRIVGAPINGPVEIWDAFSGGSSLQLVGHSRPVVRAVFAGSDSLVASAGQDEVVGIWDARTGRSLASLYTGDALVQTMVWLDAADRFCLAGTGRLSSWDLRLLDERIRGRARDLLREAREDALTPAARAALSRWLGTPDAPVCRP